MKLSINWLKDYVDLSGINIEELESKLFSCGFEVEGVIKVGDDIQKVVVGKITSIEKHPNADKLQICMLDCGKFGTLQIVTGAKNVAVGDMVPVALDGSLLPGGKKIVSGELRGVESNGMLCSGGELGIGDEICEGASVNGILILHGDYKLGDDIVTALGFSDTIFDIGLTANRPDCQSVFGMAREVAAVLSRPLKTPSTTYNEVQGFATKDMVNVTVKDGVLCPRYMANYVYDIKIAQSPAWIKRRLASVGIRSINNIVDITNFVLTEIGQPMHAFDYANLAGKEIIVRRAANGEKITTLDEKEFSLTDENLVICDAEKPSALAGIMGGLNSGISDKTNAVVFESASFKRDNIRRSSRALAQKSDSSARFEKGVDLYSVEFGMARALHLIDELGAGKIAKGSIDVLSSSRERRVIKTTFDKINNVIGVNVPKQIVCQILNKLDFGVMLDGNSLTVTIPLYREDVEGYQDLAEEVIRSYGYQHIVPRLLSSSTITNGFKTHEQKNSDKLKNAIVDLGFSETLTYSFVSEKEYDIFGIDKTDEKYKFVKLLNALGEDMSVMRTSLAPSMAYTMAKNLNRKNMSGRLFEFANIYHYGEPMPKEETVIALGVFGEDEDFFSLKGVIENILSVMYVTDRVDYSRSNKKYLHPLRDAEISICGVNVGYFGELNPETAEKIGLSKRVYVAELYYDTLKHFFDKKLPFAVVSKYPSIERDIALIGNATNGEIIDCINSTECEFLKKVELFDVYEGIGGKSMAYRLTFVSEERTLGSDEVENAVGKILAELKQKLNVKLR